MRRLVKKQEMERVKINLTENQRDLLVNQGFIESQSKPGLWYHHKGKTTEFIDVRTKLTVYYTDHDGRIQHSPWNSLGHKLARQIKALDDKQSLLEV